MSTFKKYLNNYKMVEERLSMANMIMNDLESGLKRVSDVSDAHDLIEEYMLENGGVDLGSGVYSNVYEGMGGGGYVIKTAFDDKHLDRFLTHAAQFDNPLIPNVVAQRKITYGGEFGETMVVVYIMEKLRVDHYKNKRFIKDLISFEPSLYEELKSSGLGGLIKMIAQDEIDIAEGKKIDAVLREKGKVTYDQLYEFGHILYDVTGNFNNDVHGGNFGFNADGQLVIFDPLSHSRPTHSL